MPPTPHNSLFLTLNKLFCCNVSISLVCGQLIFMTWRASWWQSRERGAISWHWLTTDDQAISGLPIPASISLLSDETSRSVQHHQHLSAVVCPGHKECTHISSVSSTSAVISLWQWAQWTGTFQSIELSLVQMHSHSLLLYLSHTVCF